MQLLFSKDSKSYTNFPNAATIMGIALVIVSVCTLAISQLYPTFIAKLAADQKIYSRIIPLTATNTIKQGAGYAVDISDYGLVTLADTDTQPAQSPLVLLENGKALVPHASEQDIEQSKPGVFRHARPSIKSMEDAYNYDRNRKDRLVFVPYNKSSNVSSFQLSVPATKADAWAISKSSQGFKAVSTFAWVTSLILALVGCVLIMRYRNNTPHFYYQLPLLISVGLAYYFMTATAIIQVQVTAPPGAYTYFNSFGISPDTSSYYPKWNIDSSRTPGYPWFIRMTAKSYNTDEVLKTTPVGVAIDYSHPFKRVNTVQIILLLLSGLVLMYALMHYLKSPLPVIPFLFIYKYNYFVWYELNFILTETLMQAALLTGIAFCFSFLFEKKPWLLFAASLFLGYAYLVRPAGIFGSLILGATILYALAYSWRNYWKTATISFILYLFVFIVPNIHGFLFSGKFFSGADSYQYKVCYALRIAQPEDVNLLPSKELKAWFADAMARRAASDIKYDTMTAGNTYNRLVYRIQSVYESALTDNPNKLAIPVYNEFSSAIFKHRRADYLKFSFDFWRVTVFGSQVDRIGIMKLPSWAVYGLMLLLGLLLRTKVAYFAGILVVSHWAHIFICCLFSAPIARMVWSSDILVIIALALLLIDMVNKVLQKAVPYPAVLAPSPKQI